MEMTKSKEILKKTKKKFWGILAQGFTNNNFQQYF